MSLAIPHEKLSLGLPEAAHSLWIYPGLECDGGTFTYNSSIGCLRANHGFYSWFNLGFSIVAVTLVGCYSQLILLIF